MKNGMHETKYGTRWYKNGKLHREDGPAIVNPDGTKVWYLNGKRHREDGPAIEYADGDKYWHRNGKLHREDGPAVITAHDEKFWCLNDKWHSLDEWLEEMNFSDEDKLFLKLKWV